MKAESLLRDKRVTDSLIIERVVWRLPETSEERPHGLKYRLYCGTHSGQCLVRYDNEAGKGDHRHYGALETGYSFTSLTALLADFHADIERLTGENQQ